MTGIIKKMSLSGLALTCALAAPFGMASAAEIKLIAIGAVKVPLDKIIADYAKQTGNEVKFTAGSPPQVAQKVTTETYDVVVQSAAAMEDAVKAGAVKGDSRVAVVRGGIGMAVRKGAPVPDVSTPEKFKQTLMAASSIVVTDPAMANASGAATQRILTEAGVADSIKAKTKVIGLDQGQEAISKGEYELGFYNISEVRPYVQYVGPVPAPLQKYTTYEAAVTTKASGPAADFVKMLASAGSAAHWKEAGLEPQAGK